MLTKESFKLFIHYYVLSCEVENEWGKWLRYFTMLNVDEANFITEHQ